MDMEMDRSIALFLREQWEKEEEEKKARLKEYNSQKQVTYTVEALAEGIRRGEQELDTLRMEFEPRKLLEGRLTIPYIKEFFDMEDDESGTALLVSNKYKVTMNFSDAPCKKMELSMDKWISQTKQALKGLHLYMQMERKETLGNMEYFCYVLPTAKGRLYNIMFRMQKGDRLHAGALNCPEDQKERMGLLLEAITHVIVEMNC